MKFVAQVITAVCVSFPMEVQGLKMHHVDTGEVLESDKLQAMMEDCLSQERELENNISDLLLIRNGDTAVFYDSEKRDFKRWNQQLEQCQEDIKTLRRQMFIHSLRKINPLTKVCDI